jgi:diacylglycerol kinase family enzyme
VKAVIIVNPISGRGRSLKTIELILGKKPFPDWEFEVLPTAGPGSAGVLSKELRLRPPDLLAVCGGDGTLNEVVSAIPDPPCPVALLPAGTANVLARELNLRRSSGNRARAQDPPGRPRQAGIAGIASIPAYGGDWI